MKEYSTVIERKEEFTFCFSPETCKKCSGYCCRGTSGYIWVNQFEIQQICQFLKVNSIDFIQKYCWKQDSRYSLREHCIENDYQCIFFDATMKCCLIYKVRPKQCQKYPFWEYFLENENMVLKECPGVIADC